MPLNTLPESVRKFILDTFTDPETREVKARLAEHMIDSVVHGAFGSLAPNDLYRDVFRILELRPGDDALLAEELIAKYTTSEDEPAPATPPETITPEREVELVQVQNSAAIAAQAVMDAEGVLRDLGRLDAALFFATVADSMLVQIFEKVKREKAYNKIPIRDEAGNVRLSHDLKEFCEFKLGKSYRRLQELSSNMRNLGPALYEAAEKVGFKSRDYRALNALPAEEQAVVKQALESESKDEVLDILQDMAARHQAEKEAAKKERDDLKADMDAKDKVLEVKAQRLDKAEIELQKLKSLPKDADTELRLEVEAEAVKELNRLHVTALAIMNQFMAHANAMTTTPGISTHTMTYAMQIAQVLCEDIGNGLAEQGIPVDFEEIVQPQWMRATAKQNIETGDTNATAGAH